LEKVVKKTKIVRRNLLIKLATRNITGLVKKGYEKKQID
jgi:hypothetical protein